MPVYVYRCESCGSQFDRKQSFADAPLTECESCGGRLWKVFQPATIIYKGSGFYSTDHRSKSGGNGRNGNGESEKEAKPTETTPASSKESPAPAATSDGA